jgi:transcriptional regulator with XRE-family HTH domain
MDTTIQVIGQTIKELRSRRALTLDQVAERSGCTPGFLSQVERNKAVPSLTTLHGIAQALGVPVADLLPDVGNRAKVVRGDARESFHFEGSATSYTVLTTKFSTAGLAGFVMTFRPATQSLPTDEARAHPGEEFYHVLEGVLTLSIGDERHELHPGDSVYFKSTVKHRLENRETPPAVVLGMITPSIF